MDKNLSQKSTLRILSPKVANMHYHEISNISGTKSKNLSDCGLVLQLPLANPLKPDVKSKMKM